MKFRVKDLKINVTYCGKIDYKRGLSEHRTLLSIDHECGVVTFRNEVGPNPPDCYVALSGFGLAEFADWVEGVVPAAANEAAVSREGLCAPSERA
jgi:hypothetical protein